MSQRAKAYKRVIWQSKTKQAWVVIICFGFVAAEICTGLASKNIFMFWLSIVFWGAGGLFMLIRLLNPKNVFAKPGPALGKQIISDEFDQLYNEDGFFSYDGQTFTVQFSTVSRTLCWADIECLFGYKIDLYTTDEICLDVFLTDGSHFAITESTRGWHKFLRRLSENIPAVPKNWDIEIWTPVFETTLTLLYDKKGRNQQQAEAAYHNN